MHVYLPIAEMSVNVLVFLGLGGAVGFLSGLFGVGGGFLLTPLLIFLGIPPAVAVGTGAAHIVASSVSGAITQYRRIVELQPTNVVAWNNLAFALATRANAAAEAKTLAAKAQWSAA